MRITGFRLYPVPFAFADGGFTTSYGRRTHLNSLLLALETDVGITGYVEVCRKAGNTPEPADPAVAAQHARLLGPVVGADAWNIAEVRARLGDPGAAFSNLTSAVECACLDIAAKQSGQPLWVLLGGRLQDSIPEYRSIGQGDPEAMATEALGAAKAGCRVFQIKVGGHRDLALDRGRIAAVLGALDDGMVLLADANGGWDPDSAAGMLGDIGDPRLLWEEPCRSYAENRAVAERTGAPVVLDQCLSGPEVVARACADGAVAGLGIKCTMQGGPMAARLARDLAVAHGLKLKVDDSWCADVATALSLHLALAVPPGQLICGIDMRPYFAGRLAEDGPVSQGYRLSPADAPGLGVTPDTARLGAPIGGA